MSVKWAMNTKNALNELLTKLGEDQLQIILEFARFVHFRQEREEWRSFGAGQLARCYGPDEPEYTEADVKSELNP